MAIQSSYAENISALQAGQLVNQEPATIMSRIVETAAGIGFGKVVVQGANAKGVKVSAAAGTAAGAAVAGNTGNGTITAEPTVGAGAKTGVYQLVCVEPGTNVGEFQVFDPDGLLVGVAVVATEFAAGGLTFTIADGSTDFASGDRFTITVSGAPVFRGITVRNPAVEPDTADTYEQYQVCSVLTKGVIAVAASVAVTAGQAAYFVPATGVITNVPAGNLPIPGGIFDTSAAQNALVALRIS